MKCPECKNPLAFRNTGGKRNPKNYSTRSGSKIILLSCSEHGKFCCGVEAGSKPYKTAEKKYIRRWVFFTPEQIKFLDSLENPQDTIRFILDRYMQSGVH